MMNELTNEIKANKPCILELMWALIDRKAQQIGGEKLEPFEEHVIQYIETIRKQERIATLEEVLKHVKQMRVNWGSQKVLVLLSKWLSQQLNEAKGVD